MQQDLRSLLGSVTTPRSWTGCLISLIIHLSGYKRRENINESVLNKYDYYFHQEILP